MTKTNALRLIAQAGIPHRTASYDFDEHDLSGAKAAAAIGMPPEQVFKTLVARGDKTGVVVFCIPVLCTLDLKKAAKVSGNKKVEMVHMNELLPLTGYIRGGCSPIGMKKHYPTVVDESARPLERMIVSAGRIGDQIELAPGDLQKATGCSFAAVAE